VIEPPKVESTLHPLRQTVPAKSNFGGRRLHTHGKWMVIKVCFELGGMEEAKPFGQVGKQLGGRMVLSTHTHTHTAWSGSQIAWVTLRLSLNNARNTRQCAHQHNTTTNINAILIVRRVAPVHVQAINVDGKIERFPMRNV
jgi:hypothetical protein